MPFSVLGSKMHLDPCKRKALLVGALPGSSDLWTVRPRAAEPLASSLLLYHGVTTCPPSSSVHFAQPSHLMEGVCKLKAVCVL